MGSGRRNVGDRFENWRWNQTVCDSEYRGRGRLRTGVGGEFWESGGKLQYGRRMNGLRRPAQPVSSIGNMHKLSGVCLCILPLCNLTNLI
jgi:hypothetical protein